MNGLPQVGAATGVRVRSATDVAHGSTLNYVAVDPGTVGKVFDIGMTEGRIDALTADGVLVQKDTAASRHLRVGDTLQVGLVNGSVRALTVIGIYSKDDLAGKYVVSQALHEQSGADQFDFSVFVAKASGVSDADARAAISALSDKYSNATLQSRAEYIDAQARQIDQIVNLMYALLGLAVIVALLSIANSISLSIYERSDELGLLRAVGMTRHQTGSAVRWEALIVALLGTALGGLLGVCFGWAISVTLRDQGLARFDMPLTTVLLVVAAGAIGGVVAAVRPAWRVAHLDVLRAIATE